MTAPTVSAARLAELIADKDAGDSLGPWDRDTLACLRELSSARQEMERLTKERDEADNNSRKWAKDVAQWKGQAEHWRESWSRAQVEVDTRPWPDDAKLKYAVAIDERDEAREIARRWHGWATFGDSPRDDYAYRLHGDDDVPMRSWPSPEGRAR